MSVWPKICFFDKILYNSIMNNAGNNTDDLFEQADRTRRIRRHRNLRELRRTFSDARPIEPRSDTLHTARRTYVQLHGDPYAIDPEVQQEILDTTGHALPMARTRGHLLKLLFDHPAPAVLPPNASVRDVVMGKIGSHARHGTIDVDLLAEECAQDPALAHLTQAERWTLVTACMGEYERAKNE